MDNVTVIRSLTEREKEVLTFALQFLTARRTGLLANAAQSILDQKMVERMFWASGDYK